MATTQGTRFVATSACRNLLGFSTIINIRKPAGCQDGDRITIEDAGAGAARGADGRGRDVPL